MNITILESLGLPEPEREYRFDAKRRFRFDFAWPEIKLAVEINGGIWTLKPSHSRAGHIRDMEKLNLAAEMGWIVLQYEPKKIQYQQIERVYSRLWKFQN